MTRITVFLKLVGRAIVVIVVALVAFAVIASIISAGSARTTSASTTTSWTVPYAPPPTAAFFGPVCQKLETQGDTLRAQLDAARVWASVGAPLPGESVHDYNAHIGAYNAVVEKANANERKLRAAGCY